MYIYKQAHEVILTLKPCNTVPSSLTFNNSPVQKTSTKKHLGMISDNKLDFREHFKAIPNKKKVNRYFKEFSE